MLYPTELRGHAEREAPDRECTIPALAETDARDRRRCGMLGGRESGVRRRRFSFEVRVVLVVYGLVIAVLFVLALGRFLN